MAVYNKIGWNIGVPANAAGYGDYVRALDKAGIPAVSNVFPTSAAAYGIDIGSACIKTLCYFRSVNTGLVQSPYSPYLLLVKSRGSYSGSSGPLVLIFPLLCAYAHVLASGYILKVLQAIVVLLIVFMVYLLTSFGKATKGLHNQHMNKKSSGLAINRKANTSVSIWSLIRLQVSFKNCATARLYPSNTAKVANLVITLVSEHIFPNFFHGETSKENAPYWFGSRQRSNQCGAHCSLYQAVKSWRDLSLLYHRPVTSSVTFPEVKA